jgi:hypothetical protein
MYQSTWWLDYLAAPICADSGRDNFFRVFEKKMEEKRNRLKESGIHLFTTFYKTLEVVNS